MKKTRLEEVRVTAPAPTGIPVKIKRARPRWTLLVDILLPPGELVHWAPTAPIRFQDGETVVGIKAIKHPSSRNTFGLVRLYRTARGHHRVLKTPNTKVNILYEGRPHALDTDH